jgi:hypothetical protein
LHAEKECRQHPRSIKARIRGLNWDEGDRASKQAESQSAERVAAGLFMKFQFLEFVEFRRAPCFPFPPPLFSPFLSAARDGRFHAEPRALSSFLLFAAHQPFLSSSRCDSTAAVSLLVDP